MGGSSDLGNPVLSEPLVSLGQTRSARRDWRSRVYAPGTPEGRLAKKLRRQAHRKTRGKCTRCGRRLRRAKWSPHHIIPRAEGGSDDISNLRALCNKCHDIVELGEDGWELEELLRGDSSAIDPAVERKPATLDDEETWDWRWWVYGSAPNPRQKPALFRAWLVGHSEEINDSNS